MATAKKKPTAAQLAARKLFAERARAGTLTSKTPKKRAASASTRHFRAGSGEEAAAAELRLAKKHAARKKNPISQRKNVSIRAKASADPHLYIVWVTADNGELKYDIAKFRKISEAKAYAQFYADEHNTPVAVTGKKL